MSTASIELHLQHADGTTSIHRVRRECTIGRDPTCDIVLADAAVSRLHCKVRQTPQGFVVSDLGSSHGTWLNGVETTQGLIQHGDMLVLSPTTRFQICTEGLALTVVSESKPSDDDTATFVARPAARRQPRRLGAIVLYLVVFGAAGYGLSVWWEQQQKANAQAGDSLVALREAAAQEANGQYETALDGLAAVASTERDEALAARFAAAQARLTQLVAARAEALGILQSIAHRPEFESVAAFEETMRTARPQDPPHLISEAVYVALVAQGRGEFMKRAEARAGAARARAQEELGNRQYGRSLAILDEASRDPSLDESGRVRLRSLRERVVAESGAAFEKLRVNTRSAQTGDARTLLLAALPRFEGTTHEGELRALIGLASLSAAVAVESGAVVSSTVAPAASNALREAVAAAETLAARRAFAEAARSFVAAAETADSDAGRTFCSTRRARMERLTRLPGILSAAASEHPAMFRGISLGNEMRGDLRSVDERGLEFRLGAGATLRVEWSRLEAARAALLMQAARLCDADARVAAEWLIEARAPDRALALLAQVGVRDAAFRSNVADLVAEAKGLRGIPAGGFEFFSGTFLTAEEKAQLADNRRVDAAAAKVDTARGLEWRVALDELLAGGEGPRAAARKALLSRYERVSNEARALSEFSGNALLKLRQKLRVELDEARAHALALIRDERNYPYPYGANQREVQDDVDARVARVAELWNKPSLRVLDNVAALRDAYARVEEVARALSEVGGESRDPTDLLEWIDRIVDMPRVAASTSDAERLAENQELAEYANSCASNMSVEERECFVATNEYRAMMGLNPVLPDDRLVTCARGHSEEMQRLGYFAHESPTKGREKPGQRAVAAGWTSGVSENIASGQPTGLSVVAAWRGSSGHHRNLLGRHTHLGCGKAQGAFWTQNFSRSPLPKKATLQPKPGRDPRSGPTKPTKPVPSSEDDRTGEPAPTTPRGTDAGPVPTGQPAPGHPTRPPSGGGNRSGGERREH